MITNEDVRSAQVVAQNNQPDAVKYRCLIKGKNLYVYRFVEAGLGYLGRTYKVPGYAYCWADINEVRLEDRPPQFVPLRREDEEK